MAIHILLAGLIAFLIVGFWGKRFVPWLEKHGIKQPIKEELTRIYSNKNDDSSLEE